MGAKENRVLLYFLIVCFSGLLYFSTVSNDDPKSSPLRVKEKDVSLDAYKPSTSKAGNGANKHHSANNSGLRNIPMYTYLSSGFCDIPPMVLDPTFQVREIVPEYVPLGKYPCNWVTFSNDIMETLIGTPPIKLCTHNPEVDKGTSALLVYGQFDKPIQHQLFTFSRGLCTKDRPMVIVAGGGIGVTALLAANENCHVVAMEPTPENSFRMAQAILANEMEDRLTIIDIALDTKWSKETYSFLKMNSHQSGNVFPPRDFIEVTTGTLDGIIFSSQTFLRHEHRFSHESIHTLIFDTHHMNELAFLGSLQTITTGKIPLIIIYLRQSNILSLDSCLQVTLIDTIFNGSYDVFADDVAITINHFKEWASRVDFSDWTIHIRLERRMHEPTNAKH